MGWERNWEWVGGKTIAGMTDEGLEHSGVRGRKSFIDFIDAASSPVKPSSPLHHLLTHWV
jgi:hypothetical protein